MLRSASQRIVLASDGARLLIAFAAGLLAAVAMPPLYLLPALFVALPIAVFVLDGAGPGRLWPRAGTLWRAFAAGWAFGFGYFVAGLWWLGAAFLVESDEFLWALPLGVVGLPAFLAIFHGLGFALARLLWSETPLRILALAFGLGAVELLRGHVLTGFPWNSLGQAAGAHLALLQSASLFGVEGLGVLLVAIAAAPAALAAARPAARLLPISLAALALAGLMLFGHLRLEAAGGYAAGTTGVQGVRLRVVQPNVAQREKDRPDGGADLLRRYLALSDRSTSPASTGLADVTHLVWPESAFPFLLAEEPVALAAIADALPPSTVLITGAVRRLEGEAGAADRFGNALLAIDSDGAIFAAYDKIRLVPFGEFLPLDATLRTLGLRQFVSTPGTFEPGRIRPAIATPGAPPLLPLICYEAIFPEPLNSDLLEAAAIVNVTNDAWFGETFGPHQHFEQARMRAVEYGIPLIRSANTGISAVVDAYGRIVRQIPLGEEGVIDSHLPPRAEATPMVALSRTPVLALLILAFIATIGGKWLGARDRP
jgi:apolipoprotein N-acyltransferase